MNPNDAIILVIVLITLVLGLGTWFLIHAFNKGLSDLANSRLSRGWPVGAGGVVYAPAVQMSAPPADATKPAASEKSDTTSKSEV